MCTHFALCEHLMMAGAVIRYGSLFDPFAGSFIIYIEIFVDAIDCQLSSAHSLYHLVSGKNSKPFGKSEIRT